MIKEVQKSKFKTMWENPFEVITQDLSNPYQDLIEEIPSFTKDENGKWLNDSSLPKFVVKGKINVQEGIQSFADDVDIYKILEKFAATGDESIINRNVGFYYDISNIPTNFNDFQAALEKNSLNLDLFSKEMKEKILNGDNISQEMFDNEVKAIAKDKYNIDFDNKENDKKEEVKE